MDSIKKQLKHRWDGVNSENVNQRLIEIEQRHIPIVEMDMR